MLWNHQKAAIEGLSGDAHIGALLFDPGCGKTRTTIEILKTKEGKTLILGPIAVLRNWEREIKQWWPERKFKDNEIMVLSGPGPQRIRKLRSYQPNIIITNSEAVRMGEFWKHLTDYGFQNVIIDESQRFKNPAGLGAKKLAGFLDSVKQKNKRHYISILTGTVATNGPNDLFMQFRLLSKGIFGSNYYTFRNKYFYDANSSWRSKERYFPDWKIKENAAEEMREKISEVSYFAKKSECLDLPPLIQVTRDIELTDRQRKHYDQLYKDFVTYVGDAKCQVDLAITKLLRCLQICSGILQTDEGLVLLETNKDDDLSDILADIPKEAKIIVWSRFVPSYDRIEAVVRASGKRAVRIVGGQRADTTQAAIDEFNRSDGAEVCIASQTAGGVGINLQRASYSYYYSRCYSLEADEQSQARNYRGGSEIHASVTRYDAVVRGTVEEDIVENLRLKKTFSDYIQGIKKR